MCPVCRYSITWLIIITIMIALWGWISLHRQLCNKNTLPYSARQVPAVKLRNVTYLKCKQCPWIVHGVILCAFPLKDSESSEAKGSLVSCAFSPWENTCRVFCLALSASLIPLLTRVNTECKVLWWPDSLCVCVYVCVCVRWQLQYKTVTWAHTQMLHVPVLCLVCVIKIKLYGHVYHLQRKRVTSDSHMNSTPSFYIRNLRPSWIYIVYSVSPS